MTEVPDAKAELETDQGAREASGSKPDRGTVKVHTRAFKQDGALVAQFKRVVLVPRREPGAPLPEAETNVD